MKADFLNLKIYFVSFMGLKLNHDWDILPLDFVLSNGTKTELYDIEFYLILTNNVLFVFLSLF